MGERLKETIDELTRAQEEQNLDEIITIAQKNLDHAQQDLKEANEQLADLLETYDIKDKEGLTLWNNATARLWEYKHGIVRLEKARKKPYFGRIDFLNEKNRKEGYYIGRVGITDSEDQAQPVVLDWRAPIASVYYESSMGPCTYTVLAEGNHTINLKRKRTYEIADDQLLDYFDSDVVANDELLTKYLAKNKKAVLGEIIATIQKEQNLMIRRSPKTNLIVQGVAGSGKTTVAMHRISYILYNYKEDFRPEDFYIVGSNRILLDYITSVLPELDVYGIRQMTMEQLLIRLLYEDWDENKYSVHDLEQANAAQHKKGTSLWFEKLEAFCQNYEKSQISQEAVVLEKTGIRLMRPAMVREYLRDHPLLSMESKILMLNQMLYARYENEVSGKQVSYTAVEKKKMERKYSTYYGNGEWKGSVLELYQSFLAEEIEEESELEIPTNSFDVYDLAAMAYIYKRIKETDPIREASHVVIDEAQDFGMMVYHCLHYCLRGCTYTIMGDTSQNIHFQEGLNDWEELRNLILTGTYDAFGILRKSYRNTVEISQFASEILRHGEFPIYPVEPIIRHGNPVTVTAIKEETSIWKQATKILEGWRMNGYETIAVICRDEEEAIEVSNHLSSELAIHSYTSEMQSFDEGIVVLPVAYTKGLEFDCVLLFDPNGEKYPQDDHHVKLLYVAATRALHELTVLAGENLTDIIKTTVPEEKHMKEFAVETLQKAKEYSKPVYTQRQIEEQRIREGDLERSQRGYIGPKKITVNQPSKEETKSLPQKSSIPLPKPEIIQQPEEQKPVLREKKSFPEVSIDQKNESSYAYGSLPQEQILRIPGHSRSNFTVKWGKKTKEYLEIASVAGLLRLIPITPQIIRVAFVKGVTGSIQETPWIAKAETPFSWSARESRTHFQLMTEQLLVSVEKATGAITFSSRDGKKLLEEKTTQPRLILDNKTWNFFSWEKTDHIKAKGILSDDYMDLSTKARCISFGGKKLRMPLLLSKKGYGIGIASENTVIFSDVKTYGQYIHTQGSEQIDYYFIQGMNPEEIVLQYAGLVKKK